MWDHFLMLRENSKKHALCKYCKNAIKNVKPGGNMLQDFIGSKQCKLVPVRVREALEPTTNQGQQLHVLQASVSSAPTVQCPVAQEAFEMALAKVFFVCALPFVLVDSPVFRAFIELVSAGAC